MQAFDLTPHELRERGMDALRRELGTVSMVRFLQQLERGKGDYSKERHETVGKISVDEIAQDIRAGRK